MTGLLNGYVVPILISIIGGLLALVQLLIGLVLKAHKEHIKDLHIEIDRRFTDITKSFIRARLEEEKDKDRRFDDINSDLESVRTEIVRIRDRLHEWASHIGWVDQQRRGGK